MRKLFLGKNSADWIRKNIYNGNSMPRGISCRADPASNECLVQQDWQVKAPSRFPITSLIHWGTNLKGFCFISVIILHSATSSKTSYNYIFFRFVKILKEEVRDLLDPTLSVGKLENGNGNMARVSNVPGKPPVQIREASNGVITLTGSTEIHVASQKEMAACLDQGSNNRATGSTNMNNQSRLVLSFNFIIRKATPIFLSSWYFITLLPYYGTWIVVRMQSSPSHWSRCVRWIQ